MTDSSWLDDIPSLPPTTAPTALLSRLRDTFSPAELAVALSLSTLPFLAAALSGVDLAFRRSGMGAVDDYDCAQHRHVPLIGPTELDRNRWPPTGDRRLWVEYGPEGPPGWAAGAAA